MTDFSNNLVNNFPEYLFNKINTQKLHARKDGRDVIDLGYGNPDIPTHPIVVDKLIESAKNKKKPQVLSFQRNRGFKKCHEGQVQKSL